MTLREQAVAKMQANKRPLPSDTPYFFGLTAEENAALPHPLPAISDCDVTTHENGAMTFHRHYTGPRRAVVPHQLLVEQACRKQGVSRERADIMWD